MKKRLEIKKLALSAVVCALSVIVCILGSILNIADLTACTVAAGLLYLAMVDLKARYSVLTYIASSVLMWILFPYASGTVFYVAFFGYYPLIKGILERLPKVLIYIAKLALFNGVLLLLFKFATFLFIAEGEATDSPLLIAALVLANIFFLVFDFALTVLSMAYKNHFRRIWGIERLMR